MKTVPVVNLMGFSVRMLGHLLTIVVCLVSTLTHANGLYLLILDYIVITYFIYILT